MSRTLMEQQPLGVETEEGITDTDAVTVSALLTVVRPHVTSHTHTPQISVPHMGLAI